eukprot:scaffold64111_cov18-Tisochrysis_lutea.AAC.1
MTCMHARAVIGWQWPGQHALSPDVQVQTRLMTRMHAGAVLGCQSHGQHKTAPDKQMQIHNVHACRSCLWLATAWIHCPHSLVNSGT